MINVNNVSLRIKKKDILKQLSFDLHTGEHVAVLGANGAGKSTLLKTLVGDWPGYDGSISYNGKNLNTLHRRTLARMRAVLPQDIQLNFPFLAQEVVEMGSSPHTPGPQEINIVRECMALFDVRHLADRRYPELSGGEKQRVQLARVFCQLWSRQGMEPARYLFLDECSSALDPCHQIHVFKKVRQLCLRNMGVLSIMHDMNLAAEFADRILLMHQGAIIADGKPEEVLTPDLLKQAYDIQAAVLAHPLHGGPLVLNQGAA